MNPVSDSNHDKVKQWLKPAEENSSSIPQKMEESRFVSKKPLKSGTESITAKVHSKHTSATFSTPSPSLKSEATRDYDSDLSSIGQNKTSMNSSLPLKGPLAVSDKPAQGLQRSLPYALPSEHPPPLKEANDVSNCNNLQTLSCDVTQPKFRPPPFCPVHEIPVNNIL